MAKEKAVNYTEAQVARMREVYTGADNASEVAALATEFGKTPASVRAKLSNLGLYKAAEKADDAGERITKMVIAEAIGEKVGLMEHEVEGLSKASKAALDKILRTLS